MRGARHDGATTRPRAPRLARLVVALVLTLVTARPCGAQRYVFGPALRDETLVLDTQTGRIWRYEKRDDAWYVYGLEAPTPAPGATPEPPVASRSGETARRE